MAVVVAAGLLLILGCYKRHLPSWRADYLALLLFGAGLAILSWPVVLSHYLANDEYRLWLIQGPPPFHQMGGGPYLLWKGLGWLISGFGLIIAALQIKLKSKRDQRH